MQCLRIQTFFASYLGSHCIEVPLKRSFWFNEPKKLVPLNESLTYLGSQLSGVFLVKFSKEFQGPRKTVSVSKSPTYPGSHLTGVYWNYRTAHWHIRPQSDDEQGINKLPPKASSTAMHYWSLLSCYVKMLHACF